MKMNMNTAIAILNILNKPGMDEVTGKSGYAIYRNIRILNTETEEFFKMKDTIVRKYGKEDENGNISILETDENYRICAKEIEDLLGIDLDIDIFKIKKEDFSIYCPSLTTRDYMLLEELFIEKE